MTPRIFLAALVLVCASFTLAPAQDIGLPKSGAALDALFPPSTTFVSPGTTSSPTTFVAPSSSSLFTQAPTFTPPRTSSLGAMSSPTGDRLTNPVAYLTGSTSGALASPGKYDSGASSSLSTLPTSSSGMVQKFQIPTASFGAPATLPMTGAPPSYAPTGGSQLYFGTR